MGMICTKIGDSSGLQSECLPAEKFSEARIVAWSEPQAPPASSSLGDDKASTPSLNGHVSAANGTAVESFEATGEAAANADIYVNPDPVPLFADATVSDGESDEPPVLGNTSILARELEGKIDELFTLLNDPRFHPEMNGFDREFSVIEQRTAHHQYYGDFTSAQHPLNRFKNRYSNVLPPESTRVRLKEMESDPTADYINANIIRGLIPDTTTSYIATQGPLNSTLGDFWRMVWEFDVSVIVMLTKEVENGRLKCDRYWPEAGGSLTAAQFTITLNADSIVTEELTTRFLTVKNEETGEQRIATQFQYVAWPDHGLPAGTGAFLDLSRKVDEANTSRGPIIVHCSAGIGRSGTFCTVHSIVEKLKRDLKEKRDGEPVFSIVDTVLHLREQRPGMVQTREQYIFCYCCVFEAYKEIMEDHQLGASYSDSVTTNGGGLHDSGTDKSAMSLISLSSTGARLAAVTLPAAPLSSAPSLPPMQSVDSALVDELLQVPEVVPSSLAGQAGQIAPSPKHQSVSKQLDKKARLVAGAAPD